MKTTAIVTLYNPTYVQHQNIESYAAFVDRVILCDNSKKDNSELFRNIENAIYIANHFNKGLSKAFNDVLTAKKYNWSDDEFIIFFDQDSFMRENIISILLERYISLENQGYHIGCLGPSYFNKSSDELEYPKEKCVISNDIISVHEMITSSMLSRYKVLQSISFFNERIFLDMADWDMCWRLVKNGYMCCVCKDICINHSVGNKKKTLLFHTMRVWEPIRTYYQVRDGLNILHENYLTNEEKQQLHKMVVLYPIAGLLFLERKKERIKYLINGIKDYRLGITGEYRYK